LLAIITSILLAIGLHRVLHDSEPPKDENALQKQTKRQTKNP
jgi:hypothetical protein